MRSFDAGGNNTDQRKWTVPLVIVLLLSITGYLIFIEPMREAQMMCDEVPYSAFAGDLESKGGGDGTATSGRLWRGDKVYNFAEGAMVFAGVQDLSSLKYKSKASKEASSELEGILNEKHCDYWSVVTTIFEPSEAVQKQARIPGWCLVVVGDKKGPFEYPLDCPEGEEGGSEHHCVFLSAEKQLAYEAHFPVVGLLPWNHFGRKNVGFLYAILHGAKLIWDFDDDNILLSDSNQFTIPGMDLHGDYAATTTPATATTTGSMDETPGAVSNQIEEVEGNEGKEEKEGIRQRRQRQLLETGETAARRHRVVRRLNIVDAAVDVNVRTPSPQDASFEYLREFNPYPFMMDKAVTEALTTQAWPRGYPLEHIKFLDKRTSSSTGFNAAPVSKSPAETPGGRRLGALRSLASSSSSLSTAVSSSLLLKAPMLIVDGVKQMLNLVTFGAYGSYDSERDFIAATSASSPDAQELSEHGVGLLSPEAEEQALKELQLDEEGRPNEIILSPQQRSADTETGLEAEMKEGRGARERERRVLGDLPARIPHSAVKLAENVKIKSNHIGIVQSLANNDPDVDGIYRLTQPLPFSFSSQGSLMLVPSSSYSPYNAQATLHFYPALWSLLLPVTVHGRVSDIWRGYMFQKIAKSLGLFLTFSPPQVAQFRNDHNYMADFQSEEPLYTRAQRLVEQLDAWHPSPPPGKSTDYKFTAPELIEQLWVMMYEHGYLGLQDVQLLQAWLVSLITAGYTFPPVIQ